jgi:acyl-CoA thioesterase FadM
MARVKITFPASNPLFTCRIPVRITDINYGNHLGNDAVLSMLHEARMQLLSQWGYTELEAGGTSLIMGDVMIAYKSEAFYGEILSIDLYCVEMTDRSFDLLYKLTTLRDGIAKDVAHAKTGMVCFDYKTRKISPLTDSLKTRLLGEGN